MSRKDTSPGEDIITYSMRRNVCNVAGDTCRDFSTIFCGVDISQQHPVTRTKQVQVDLASPRQYSKCLKESSLTRSNPKEKEGNLTQGVQVLPQSQKHRELSGQLYLKREGENCCFHRHREGVGQGTGACHTQGANFWGVKEKLLLWIQCYLAN